MNVKILSRKPVFKASLFTVREIEFEINNKKFIQHDVVRDPVVSVFALTDKNEICLISQYRRLLEKVTLEAVAGFINEGETPIKAAKRELKEETGLEAENWQEIKVVNTAASVTKGQAHLFLARDLKAGVPEPEDDEEITLVKMPFEDAVEKAITGEIDIATTIAGILIIDKLMQRKEL
jgi:ADP-ribose pyrophosphatase